MTMSPECKFGDWVGVWNGTSAVSANFSEMEGNDQAIANSFIFSVLIVESEAGEIKIKADNGHYVCINTSE